MTHDALLRYIATLDPELQYVYHQMYHFVLGTADTLDDDFQIAAAVVKCFETAAANRAMGESDA